MRRKKEEPNLNELRAVLAEVNATIQDNIQNIKDCKRVLIKIEKLLEPEKRRWWHLFKIEGTK